MHWTHIANTHACMWGCLYINRLLDVLYNSNLLNLGGTPQLSPHLKDLCNQNSIHMAWVLQAMPQVDILTMTAKLFALHPPCKESLWMFARRLGPLQGLCAGLTLIVEPTRGALVKGTAVPGATTGASKDKAA